MKHTPDRIARTVTEDVEKMNRESPGWFNKIRLEQDSVLISSPSDTEDTSEYSYELEIAWRTAIRMLRLMDREKKQ